MSALLAFVLTGFLSSAYADPCIRDGMSIEKKLACLDGVTAKETTGNETPRGMRQFELRFMQPVDHADPARGSFSQRVVLLHRGERAPMVLQTSGYAIFGVREHGVTSMFKTNQVQVEHRFFADSKPERMDWSKLDIRQSAADFHRITAALKKIYAGRWLGTGGSKGGMTSVFHRRFYPDDLDVTLADVAPLSWSTADARYNDFVENVGGEEYRECRENWARLQTSLLANRGALLGGIEGRFTQLGHAEVALEHSVLEGPFAFWQYANPEDANSGCKAMPVNGPLKRQYEFLQKHAAIEQFNDDSIGQFQPYYYQAATELGSPDVTTSHLAAFLRHPYAISQYTPAGVSLSYSNASMRDVADWVRTEAERVLFVYGEYDPWSAGMFPVSETGKEVRRYVVPRGNHGAKFTALPSREKGEVVALLTRWLGKAPAPAAASGARAETLEDLEFQARRKLRLR